MEQLLLLLLFGAIAFIQWLVKKSAEMREERKRQQQPPQWREGVEDAPVARSSEPPAPTQADDPDASMRRLMEALGLPQEAPPPPVPQRAPTPPPLPPTPAPRVPERPAPKFAERPVSKLPERTVSRLPERPVVPAARLSAPAAKSAPFGPPPEKKPDFSIRELLASPDSLKKAVILSEIIGAPKALKS
jgi:hypothetical protein